MSPANDSDDKRGDALNAQRFQMLEDIAKELAGDVVFPVSFNTTMRLRQALQNPDLPIARIAGLVETDPLIAAKLLKLSNSVLYRRDEPAIRNLATAINRLGLQVVKATALAIAMNQLLRSKEMAVFSEFAHKLWQHSIHSAVSARILARRQRPATVDPEEAFLAGLVHDLGASYMLYRAANYPELRQRPESLKHLIMQWHESIGVSLLNALGLPEEVVDAVIDHDQLRPGSPQTLRNLRDIVYVSNIIAGAHIEWFYQDITPPSMAELNLDDPAGELQSEIDTETQALLALLA